MGEVLQLSKLQLACAGIGDGYPMQILMAFLQKREQIPYLSRVTYPTKSLSQYSQQNTPNETPKKTNNQRTWNQNAKECMIRRTEIFPGPR